MTSSGGSKDRAANAPRSRAAAAAMLVIVAAVLWPVGCRNDREEESTEAAGDNNESPLEAPPPVEAYVEFAAKTGNPSARLSDAQMAEGLRKLAGALGSLNMGGPDLVIDLRVGAEQVLLNPASAETAAIIREAMVAAADSIERRTGPDPALRGAVESVRPDRPLIEQRAAVLYFFQQAADAIHRRTPAGPRASALEPRSAYQPVAFCSEQPPVEPEGIDHL